MALYRDICDVGISNLNTTRIYFFGTLIRRASICFQNIRKAIIWFHISFGDEGNLIKIGPFGKFMVPFLSKVMVLATVCCETRLYRSLVFYFLVFRDMVEILKDIASVQFSNKIVVDAYLLPVTFANLLFSEYPYEVYELIYSIPV